MYFDNFNKINYPFLINGKYIETTISDISNNVRLKEKLKSAFTSFNLYTIQDGDTPEIISETLYDTPDYHWILMLLNNKYDYLTDFPIPMPVFDDYCRNKYGYDKLEEIHHCQKEVDGKTIIISNPIPLGTAPAVVQPPNNYPLESTPEYDVYLAYLEEKALYDTYMTNYGITNYQYEVMVNDAKREIKYIPAEYIRQIADELGTLL